MRLALRLKPLRDKLMAIATKRPPDFIVGGKDNPYLLRWFVIPRNPVFNIYLHRFLRSDEDRALHDHPWASVSWILQGAYTEHEVLYGGVKTRDWLIEGDIKFRASGKFAHRVELTDGECWTLFVTGPRYRNWGFHCEKAGWVPWQKFVNVGDRGTVGKGCDQ